MLAVCTSAACRNRALDPPGAADDSAANASVVEWRAKHESDYRRDWVSIAALHELDSGVNTAGSAASNDVVLPASAAPIVGRFVVTSGQVRFEPRAGVTVLTGKDKQPVSSPLEMRDDSQRDAPELLLGDVRLTVHRSGEKLSLRVRDPNGPLARGFAGFNWFPIESRYRVTGRFIKDSQAQRLKVLNTYGDVDEYNTEGVIEFELDGQKLRLRPFTTRPRRFYIVFRDASSGQETYETARFLYADLRDDGTTTLDFNEAYNPPCAFNPFTTCPIPLRENRLPVKILAGEKAYAGSSPNHRP
jgi:uncharacterized protein (DUF1684 family)